VSALPVKPSWIGPTTASAPTQKTSEAVKKPSETVDGAAPSFGAVARRRCA
jgi:hypothetical protein